MVGPFGNVDAALVDEYRWGKCLNDNGGRWKIRIASVMTASIVSDSAGGAGAAGGDSATHPT